MSKQCSKFDEEYKKRAVNFSHNVERSISEVAEGFGIHESLVASLA